MNACRMLLPGLLACLLSAGAVAGDEVVVIAHPKVPPVDAATLQRLYTGRSISVAGEPVTVVNARPGSLARERFLAQVMQLDNQRYIAYWTVRRHIGKGTPPPEFASASELAKFVQETPGAVGYIEAAELRPGMNVVYRP